VAVCLLQQFARFPEPGLVKTRLARALGAEAACAVHEELVAITARTLLDAALGPVELWLDRHPRDHALLTDLVASGAQGPFIQRGPELGARMYHALADGRRRASAVLLVGSDCPGIDATYLQEAATALRSHDVVLGPAEDGGYVLVGTRSPREALFRGIPWGTGEVLAATLDAAADCGMTVRCLAPRFDIDDVADYRRWRAGGA
jgi:rSAM/selenodomain-associated transferase 1